MRRADAPPAGWYPDPEGGARLRWWEGTDWSDEYRAPPTYGGVAASPSGTRGHADVVAEASTVARQAARKESEVIVAQVRQAAREEINRAADVFSQRARAATSQFQPMISEYTNKFFRWLKIGLVLAVLVVLAWFVFEAVAQATFFDWLGDRIDNLSD